MNARIKSNRLRPILSVARKPRFERFPGALSQWGGRMARLREFFRSDAFVPTAAVFPTIDTDRLAADLSIVKEGRSRGEKGVPRFEEDALDPVEARIVERVGDLRRKGIDTFGENIKVYNARLARAADAREEIELAASQARGDFQSAVAVWQARMAAPSARVTDAISSLRKFREDHGIGHVAREANFWSWLFVALLVLVIESIANAFLFSRAMSQGFVGGVAVAGFISLVNIAIASLATYFGRNLNHRRLHWKLFGLIAAAIGIVLCLSFNLGVAHLRDALEEGFGLEEALARSWETAWHSPLALRSFLSAVLMLLGLVAAIFVGLKTYHTIDVYPGYPDIYATVNRVRREYAADLNDAVNTLEDRRNEAVSDLRDANQQMRTWIREAVDALFGQTSLRSELDRFIEHCDAKANSLLAIYRDANRAARPAGEGIALSPVPPHFNTQYVFPAIIMPRPADEARDDAAAEQRRVATLVSSAIADIERAYSESIAAYPTIAELEAAIAAGGVLPPRPHTDASLTTNKAAAAGTEP